MARRHSHSVALSFATLLGGCTSAPATIPVADAYTYPNLLIPCVNPEANGKVDCKAVMHVLSAESGMAMYSGSTTEVLLGNLKDTESVDLGFSIFNSTSKVIAAELVIESMTLDEETAATDAKPLAFQCLSGLDALVPCADMTGKWDRVVPDGMADAVLNRSSVLQFRIRYTQFDAEKRAAALHIKVKNVPGISEYVLRFAADPSL
jgi:hypothetical protein